jgi:hypothetical protein
MKKRAWYVLLSVLFCFGTVSKAGAISISIIPSSQTVAVGDAFSVDISVAGLAQAGEIVSAYDLFIGYDSNVLSITDVMFGPYLSSSFQIAEPPDGQLNILELYELSLLSDAELAELQNEVAGDLVLATLYFRALAVSQSSDLTFEPHSIFNNNDVKGLADINGVPQVLDIVGFNATITVAEAAQPVPEPATLLLLGTGVLLPGTLLRYKRRRK